MATRIQASANPADVRAWAQAQGLIPTSQVRGRLSPAVTKAYNAAHGTKYREGAFVETVEVVAKPAKGRKVTRKVNVAEVRAAAKAAGVPVGERGRIPASVLSAFVLGTLGQD